MIIKILLALLVLLVFWSLSRSMPVVLGDWVGRLAGKTETQLDDHLVEELDGAAGRIALAAGFWLAWQTLGLGGTLDAVVSTLLLLGVVFAGAVLVFEAAAAVFEFFADPHEDSGRDMLPPFEQRAQRLAGSLVAVAGTALGLAILGVDPTLLGALVLTIGLAGSLALQPALQEMAAGLDLIKGAGWRPGTGVAIGEHEGSVAAVLPSVVLLETAAGRVAIANSRALSGAVVQAEAQQGE
jgi:hypothetical protein